MKLCAIAEESRTHTVLCDKYPHLGQVKCLQYLILLRIFSLHLQNICSIKTAKHPPALKFLMDLVKANWNKMPILQDEIWRKTQKLLAAGRMRSTLFGYNVSFGFFAHLLFKNGKNCNFGPEIYVFLSFHREIHVGKNEGIWRILIYKWINMPLFCTTMHSYFWYVFTKWIF